MTFVTTISGATSILHDSESETDVGRCAKRGCYSKKINYDVKSSRQIDALIELSVECHQSIKVYNKVYVIRKRIKVLLTEISLKYWKQYDCVNAPLNINGVAFSWWNDRNGVARYFWSGSNSSIQQPICQCGIEQNCVDDFLPCNCDSVLPAQLSDIGT